MRPLTKIMRLDVYLADRGLASSRTEAKTFILEGAVAVCGKVVKKPSFEFEEGAIVTVDRSAKKYVSRGGLKLEGALDAFSVEVGGKRALDIGASSGGFTDCLLQNGAAHVIAVDSGYGQIAPTLRSDPRVTVIENFNARYMNPGDLEYVPELAVMDVSFISARLILPAVHTCLAVGGDFICLIKPQFEVGRQGIGKGGIVKDERLRKQAVEDVKCFAESLGFITVNIIKSPIMGGDGNIEFLAHFRKVGVTVEENNSDTECDEG